MLNLSYSGYYSGSPLALNGLAVIIVKILAPETCILIGYLCMTCRVRAIKDINNPVSTIWDFLIWNFIGAVFLQILLWKFTNLLTTCCSSIRRSFRTIVWGVKKLCSIICCAFFPQYPLHSHFHRHEVVNRFLCSTVAIFSQSLSLPGMLIMLFSIHSRDLIVRKEAKCSPFWWHSSVASA